MYQGSDDLWIFLAAVSAEERARLCKVVDGLDVVVEDAERVEELLTSLLAGHTAAESFALLDGAGVPVEIVDETFCRSIFDDPAAKASQLVTETWSGSVGRFEDPGLLVNLSPAACVIQRGPSMCGEHSREILLEHGYSPAEIDDMATERVILEATATATATATTP
jgi:crotonobetainyl-CoA:carnitine CoA-transferase CaiB-like acyl-CoA transferase